MASDSRRSERERFKYGICLNDECQCCKDKKVQQIPMRKEFVCAECGKELRECPPPKQTSKTPLIAAAAVAAVALIGGGLFFFLGGPSDEETPVESAVTDTTSVVKTEPETSVKTDTVVVRDTVVQNNTTTISEKTSTKTVISETTAKPAAEKPTKSSSNSSVNLGYAKFSGPVKNGKPNGMGTMRFTSSHVIDSRDSKGRVAEAGDYVTGEWKDGKLVQGRWFGSDGNVKGSLMIGM